MKRAWIGIALFSASWLFGTGYYHRPDDLAWFILIICGIPFLTHIKPLSLNPPNSSTKDPIKSFSGVQGAVFQKSPLAALCMLLPAIFVVPWPYRVIPLLLFTGLLLHLLPIPGAWPRKVSNMFVVSGILLLFQGLALFLYKHLTAFSHELPFPFPDLLALMARGLDIPSTLAETNGANAALFTMRKVHLLGTTWDFFLDPTTFCFLAGGIGLFIITIISNHSHRDTFKGRLRPLFLFILAVCLWLPLRAGIHLALFIHRSLLAPYEAPLALTNQFRDGWLSLFLLAGAVFIAAAIRVNREDTRRDAKKNKAFSSSRGVDSSSLPAVVCAFLCTLSLTCALFLDLSGPRKGSRVLVDEFHSDWEPTERPFDTGWYGVDAGYNYAAIYDYCSRFFTMNRLTEAVGVNGEKLKDCDVLILKVPTLRYKPGEVEAIKDFVKKGGGLLLIGEHTDVFYTGSYLNDIAVQFGFEFRSDCLLGIDTIFEQYYPPPVMPHPIIRHMPPLDFAVSCSIAPKTLLGRSVITAAGLRSLHADYHADNFYPQVEDYADARYGAFVQLWTKQYGKGRVAAFTDSTIFSNFSAFEPGKSELMLGMIEWLNHKNLFIDLRIPLILIGLALFAAMLYFAGHHKTPFILLISAGLLGWVVSAQGIKKLHSLNVPFPQKVRPFVRVNIDRTVCDAPLSKSGFIKGSNKGFGIFEQWILKLGYFTRRISDMNELEGDLLVFLHPNKYVDEGLREKVFKYVKEGGKVLIIDSATNKGSRANSLLYPFGLKIDRENVLDGVLEFPGKWPSPGVSPVEVSGAVVIEGGRPLITVKGKPVCVQLRHGKGTVTVAGFGGRFTDANMGVNADVVPDEALRRVFELEFSLLRFIIAPGGQGDY